LLPVAVGFPSPVSTSASLRVEGQPAFVLHARAWRETSAIVELLSRDHGRIAVVARGLTGPKKHPLRAALQPFQLLRVDYLPRGELARLLQAEAMDAAPPLQGEALMAVFYINELMLRLAPRQDPVQTLFDLYARVRTELGSGAPLGWTLRRFERDVLDAMGYGLQWDHIDDGERVDAASSYRLDSELGPVREVRRGADSVSGAALRALADDVMPTPELQQELRLALRGLLTGHLGSTPLRSWGMLGELARVGRRTQD